MEEDGTGRTFLFLRSVSGSGAWQKGKQIRDGSAAQRRARPVANKGSGRDLVGADLNEVVVKGSAGREVSMT